MSDLAVRIENPMSIPTPSGDALLAYHHGGGFLAAPHNTAPAAFKSLGDLLVYWETNAPFLGGHVKVYSLNGVHPSAAICVHTGFITPLGPAAGRLVKSHLPTLWLLYTAPSAANHAWFYLLNYLKASPGVNTRPAVKGLRVAQYVVIDGGISKGHSSACSTWFLLCNPDMKRLTEL